MKAKIQVVCALLIGLSLVFQACIGTKRKQSLDYGAAIDALHSRVERIENLKLSSGLHTDSLDVVFCDYFEIIDFDLLLKSYAAIDSPEALIAFDENKLSPIWQQHWISFKLQSLSAFRTDNTRLPYADMAALTQKTFARCPDDLRQWTLTSDAYMDVVRTMEIRSYGDGQ